MTRADRVLHLMRAGAELELARPVAAAAAAVEADEELAAIRLGADLRPEGGDAPEEYEPGLADLAAAASLVSSGLATRVTLTGFPSWPGLLWRAYRLAETADVLIIPTVSRPGQVDIVVTPDKGRDV